MAGREIPLDVQAQLKACMARALEYVTAHPEEARENERLILFRSEQRNLLYFRRQVYLAEVERMRHIRYT